jgi:hypothetical protein
MTDAIGQEISVGDLCAFSRKSYTVEVCVCKILEIKDKNNIKIISSEYQPARQQNDSTFSVATRGGYTQWYRILKLNESSLPKFVIEAFENE